MNNIFLTEEKNDEQRHDACRGGSHHHVVVHPSFQHEVLHAQRNRVKLLVQQENQRVLVIVPGPCKIDNGEGRQNRLGKRQKQSAENPKMPRSVYKGRFGYFMGNAHEKLPKHKHAEYGEQPGQNERPMGIVYVHPLEHDEFGNEQHLLRNHHQAQIQHEDDVPTLEFDAAEPVRGNGGQQWRTDHQDQ